MTRDRHSRLEDLFHRCLDVPAERRAAWLDEHCGEDRALRAELEDLLARDGGARESLVGAVLSFESDPVPGTIGPYRIGERLGEGGFGDVYAAEQEAPVRRRVAIKVLKPGMDSRAVLARFEAERQALALMDHPGIARVHDAGSTPAGRPYFVMERVDGEPITTYCERHRLDTRARLRLMIEVCRAVEHAHQKGIIHRDLKPTNLLVATVDGRPLPKVIDFGIAKATGSAAEGGTLHTREGEFLGTPEYASPEQAESGGADVDTRTDVYALGAVLYRLLAGRPPFESERLRRSGLTGMARILREEDPPRPSERTAAPAGAASRELRGDLDWIALKALEKDRTHRYASAAALAEDLERHLRDEPVLAGPPSTLYRLRKFARRRRGLVLGVAAVLVTLVAGVVVAGGQALRARRAEEDARRRAEVAGAVSTFLTRMLGAANPERDPRGADVTVREILDEAARELDATRVGGPAVESGVRLSLGSTYMGLGLYDDAQAQLDRAAALQQGPESVPGRLALAELAVRRGQYPAAESLLAGLAPAVEPPAKTEPGIRVAYLKLRGDNLTNLGRHDEADSTLTLAVAVARAAGSDSIALAASLNDLARVRVRRGAIAEAESLSREAVVTMRRARAGDDYTVASMIDGLAGILRLAGRYTASESLYREAIAIDRRVLGPDHPAVAYALGNHAVVLEEMGRLEEAERGHREGLAILRRTLGEEHPEVLIATGNFATVLQDRGRYDEALRLRLDVLDKLERVRGSSHPDVASACNNLGSLYRLMRRYAEAEAAFRRAISGFRANFGPDHPLVAVAVHNLGKTQLDDGRAVEAEATLREALTIGGRVFGPDHVNLAIFGANHARALLALGRFAEAERELQSALERMVATFGAVHPRSREATRDMAGLYARWGHPAQARSWRARADSLDAIAEASGK